MSYIDLPWLSPAASKLGLVVPATMVIPGRHVCVHGFYIVVDKPVMYLSFMEEQSDVSMVQKVVICRHPHRCVFTPPSVIAKSHWIFSSAPYFHALLFGCVWEKHP